MNEIYENFPSQKKLALKGKYVPSSLVSDDVYDYNILIFAPYIDLEEVSKRV